METGHLIENAIHAAILAGQKIMEVYSSCDFEVVEKEDLSPLTRADREAHLQIIKILASTKIPVLSEEGIHPSYAERNLWKTFWLVDPLDGTKEFISRNDEFTVNIALIYKNQPVAGVIYIPVSKELYVGIVGLGAWKILSPEQECTFEQIAKQGTNLPLTESSDKYTVAASRTHLDNETSVFIENLKKLHPELKIVRKGSSLKFCMIAEGTADIYPRFWPTMEWDTAAGHAIVKAAGKNIFHTDQKTEMRYNKENLMNPYFIAL